MLNFLCADEVSNGSSIAIYIILIVLVLAMIIMPYFTNKKRNQQFMDMLSGIKVGDLVKTAGGIIGRVTKITDKGEIKTIILETGSKSEKSYMEFDISSVYCVLKSTKVEEEQKEEKKEDVKAEDISEETKTEETPVETKVEDKKTEKPKKATAKKTASKTTSKKTTK